MNRVAMVVCMNKILKCFSIAINLISSKVRAPLPSAGKEAMVGLIEFGGRDRLEEGCVVKIVN